MVKATCFNQLLQIIITVSDYHNTNITNTFIINDNYFYCTTKIN